MVTDAHAHPLPLSLYPARLTAVIASTATIKAKNDFRAGVMVKDLFLDHPYAVYPVDEQRRGLAHRHSITDRQGSARASLHSGFRSALCRLWVSKRHRGIDLPLCRQPHAQLLRDRLLKGPALRFRDWRKLPRLAPVASQSKGGAGAPAADAKCGGGMMRYRDRLAKPKE